MTDRSDAVTERPAAAPPAPPEVEAPELRRRPVTVPWPMLALLLILAVFAAALWERGQLLNFGSWANAQGLLYQSAVPLVVALGMLLVIISGGIDLSVGSVAALVTVVTMLTFNDLRQRTGSAELAGLAAVAAGVGVGTLCGLVNGLSVTLLRVSPFVATLGMYGMAHGVGVWLADRKTVPFRGDRPEWVRTLATVGPKTTLLNVGVWSALLLCVLTALLLRRTVFGRHVYAVGSNEATARLCGVPVERTKVVLYALSGLLTGIAGVFMFARLGIGDPGSGKELELTVIAAVVIGGASLNGGQGSVTGALLGVLILAILNNGVSNFNVPLEVQYILIGVIIIVNTALSQWQRRQGE
jgi:ribose transport system permease protein